VRRRRIVVARHRSRRDHTLPEALLRLIAVAEHPFASDHAPNPDALRALARLATIIVPARGVFVAQESDVCLAIDRIAATHLGFDETRRAYHKALKAVPRFEERDPIQTAVTNMMRISDEAYFCAGLMLGVALSGR
jgi:hypothetical protein